MPWHLFQNRQPRAHLVVGALVEVAGSDYEDELAVTQYVLKRLVSKQKPRGAMQRPWLGMSGAPRCISLSTMKVTPESSPLP